MIKFLKLEISNFAGCNYQVVEFTNKTAIIGPNGSGKSTIYKAIKYCLGLNVQNELPQENNQQVKNVDTLCRLTVSVNGVIHEFSRGSKPRWGQGANDSDIVFKGNLGNYAVDAITDLKEKDYKNAIATSLGIEFEKIAMLADISYFNSTLKWEDKRELLDQLCESERICDDIISDDKYANIRDGLLELSEIALAKHYEVERKEIAKSIKENKQRISDFKALLTEFSGSEELPDKAKEWLSNNISQKIVALTDMNRSLALSDAQKIKNLALVQDYTLCKNKRIQPKVDMIFNGLTFSYCVPTISGEIKQQCEPIFEKTHTTYSQASCGEKIAMDLIVALGLRKLWNIDFPVMIDEVQSYTGQIASDSQLIVFGSKKIEKLEIVNKEKV